MDEPLVIGRGEIESSAFAVGEAVQDRLGEAPREFEVAITPASLQQLEQRIGEKRIVVEIGIQMRAAVLVRCEQPPLLPQRAVDEIDGVSRGVGEIRTMQDAGGDRESADHERVPRGQDLFIAAGPDAQRAYGQQLRAGRVDERCARPVPRAGRGHRDASGPRNWGPDRGRSGARTPRTRPRSIGLAPRRSSRRRTGPRVLPSRHRGSSKSRLAGACMSRSTQSAVSPAMCANSLSPVTAAAAAYVPRSCALSYSIFSKCGMVHDSSTE